MIDIQMIYFFICLYKTEDLQVCSMDLPLHIPQIKDSGKSLNIFCFRIVTDFLRSDNYIHHGFLDDSRK